MLLTHANYLLLCTAAAIALLMLLILRARLPPALAILISAIALGAAAGMLLRSISASLAAGAINLREEGCSRGARSYPKTRAFFRNRRDGCAKMRRPRKEQSIGYSFRGFAGYTGGANS